MIGFTSQYCALLLFLAACSSLRTSGPSTSVETILRRSENIAAQLDRLERETVQGEGKNPPAKFRPRFQQPLRQMVVNSAFGRRDGSRHDGLDLKASEGTPIYAADKGVVVFAGEEIDGYGLTVIIRHLGGFATLYAHASFLRVEVGEQVTKGQCIANAGETGNASGPHLHFEVREGMKAMNPLAFVGTSNRKLATKPGR